MTRYILIALVVIATLSCDGPEGGDIDVPSPDSTKATGAPTPTTVHAPEVDQVLKSIQTGNLDELASTVDLTSIPCTTDVGVGVGPNCKDAPGSPQDGDPVEAFPLRACESEWVYDARDAWQQFVLAYSPELFAIIELERPLPLGGLPAPVGGYQMTRQIDLVIILQSTTASLPEAGIAVEIGGAKVLTMTRTCQGNPPKDLLERYGDYQVVHQGPAFE